MLELSIVVAAGFVLALAAPLAVSAFRERAGWVLALVPAAITGWLLVHLGQIGAGEVVEGRLAWMPSLGLSLAFRLDGLSLLFGLLIAGIGALVLAYAGGYMGPHPQLGRFYGYLTMFMGSMLGLVLADNVLTLFVFWELTSISSFLLIGFKHDETDSRAAALQALLVTVAGGLAMLAGLILLGLAGGTFEISELLGQGDVVREHPLYTTILVLVLIGAFTKSAQFPFYFWLPGAMAAPTPVSAYLHSATMVKAGIYLLARFNPTLGGTEWWLLGVTGIGAITVVVAAYLALLQTDVKRMLAYTTVGALGTIVMLLGLGTELATKAAIVFLFGHALYKGTLFLVAGAIDHETGTRDVRLLGGLRGAMPYTAVFAGLAALSMAGVPPLLGFMGKELVYESTLAFDPAVILVTGAAFIGSLSFVAVAVMTGVRPFFGNAEHTPKHPHEAPLGMLLGPGLLATAGAVFGLFPFLVDRLLLSAAVSAVVAAPVEVSLALWYGVTPYLALSMVTLFVGMGLFLARGRIRRAEEIFAVPGRFGPEGWYRAFLVAVDVVARRQTVILQNGQLRLYLITILGTVVGLVSLTMFTRGRLYLELDFAGIRIYEAAIAALVLLGVLATVTAKSRLAAVAALGTVGFGVSLIYVSFGAADLAMTQLLIETLLVILFVLVLYHLPPFATLSTRIVRARDALIALASGAVMTALVLMAITVQFEPSISNYFAETAVPEGEGRNIVNVILVDFRALDTFGEIAVLALAGIGVYALLKLRPRGGDHRGEG